MTSRVIKGEGTTVQDYWFDMSENGDTKELVTYAVGGFELDRRSSDTKTWAELIEEVAPIIQEDINKYGVVQ